MDEMKCEISFTPGYRWGTTVLAGDNILMDHVYEMCGITYPDVYTFELKGAKNCNSSRRYCRQCF